MKETLEQKATRIAKYWIASRDPRLNKLEENQFKAAWERRIQIDYALMLLDLARGIGLLVTMAIGLPLAPMLALFYYIPKALLMGGHNARIARAILKTPEYRDWKNKQNEIFQQNKNSDLNKD